MSTIVIFIIIIAIIMIIRFAVDSAKQADSVKKQGGMRKKYATIVNYLIEDDSPAKIIQEDSTFIRIGEQSKVGYTYFDLTETFGTVTIQYKMKSILLGEHKLEWEFPENGDQEKMIIRMQTDVAQLLSSLCEP